MDEWFSAAELAVMALPDMPHTRQGIEKIAKSNNWRASAHARRRAGRGGGFEYHSALLPETARYALDAKALKAPVAKKAPATIGWAQFERLPDRVKAVAKRRLSCVQAALALSRGAPLGKAICVIAAKKNISERSLWRWHELVKNIPTNDWLPSLAPKHYFIHQKDYLSEVKTPFMRYLQGDYLRLERPSFAACFARACRIGAVKGWDIPHERTARRQLNKDVPLLVRVFHREGESGLSSKFPPQIRDKSGMVAMEGANADCHKWDLFVRWFDGAIIRPQMVVFQDIYSSKILSWRIDSAPNKVMVMQAFGDMVETYGIPRHLTFDNGKEFANKMLTGGAKSRFKYKIREDDPQGIILAMGTEIHWARPAHGQAKPVERAFRDMADHIAKDPRFAGAYTGHKPDAKPENYKSKAIPVDLFLKVVAEGIAAHNARTGRRGSTQQGRSFDQTFAESYAQAPIMKASEAQRRLWLMGQEVRKLHATHGALTLFKNEYWADWMSAYAGEQVVARFDPEDLHKGVHLYALKGEYLGFAATRDAAGFYDLTEAREFARIDRARKNAVKRYARDMDKLDAREVAAALNSAALARPEDAEKLGGKVVRLARPNRAANAAKDQAMGKAPDRAALRQEEKEQAIFVADFNKHLAAQSVSQESDEDRFARALALEDALAQGESVSLADRQWLQSYQNTSEYRGHMLVFSDHNQKKEG